MSPPDCAPAMTSDYAPHGCSRAHRRSHIYRRSQTSIPITPLPISTAAPSYEIVIALPPIVRCIGIQSCRCRSAHPYHKVARRRLLAIPTYDSGNRRSQAPITYRQNLITLSMTDRLRSRGYSISSVTASDYSRMRPIRAPDTRAPSRAATTPDRPQAVEIRSRRYNSIASDRKAEIL